MTNRLMARRPCLEKTRPPERQGARLKKARRTGQIRYLVYGSGLILVAFSVSPCYGASAHR